MKTELDYDGTNNLMHQKLHGMCSIQNLADVFDEMEKFELRPNLKIIADITDANMEDANYKSISFLEIKLDDFLLKFLPIHKAIIAESDLEFGIAHMYQMLAEKDGFNVEIFRDEVHAMKWLQL